MSAQHQDDPAILRQRLAEMEETLRAIREGEIDAIVVGSKGSPAVYTLKSAAEPYRLIVEQMSEGALTISSDGIILYCNTAFARMLDVPREKLVGTLLRDLVIGSVEEPLAKLLVRSGSAQELRFRAAGGAIAHVYVSSAPLIVEGVPIHCLVVTDLSRQELRILHDAIVNSSVDAIYALTLDGTIESWNPGAERLYGYTAQEAIGKNFHKLVPPKKQAETQDLLARMAAGESFKLETARVTKAGVSVEVSVSWAPIKAPQGAISGAAVIARDITERRQRESQIRLLMNEVNHRAKNLLTVVQSIARQTAKDQDAETFTERLNQRIAALAASHDLLVQSNWLGVEIGGLVNVQLAYWMDLLGTRIVAEGPAIRLKPAAAQTLGMVLHELATNAAKYGALSNAEGCIRITWNVGGASLRLRWSEHGGPPATPPRRRGFGHAIIVQMVEHTLEAEVHLEYPSSGVVWELVAPADRAVECE